MKKYSLEIIIGFQCNNNCVFCSNQSLRELCRKKGISAISFAHTKRILKSYDSKKVDTLFLIGGEPTILKNFLRIIRFAKISGYSNIVTVTNGRMCKNIEFAKKLCRANMDFVFSVHGDTADIHDSQTRSPGSFGQLVSGMDNFKSFGRGFSTNTAITKLNYEHLPGIVAFLSKYNPSLMLFSLVSPTGIPKESLDGILPPLDGLAHVIRQAILTANKLNQNIKFMDVPLCVMGEYEEYMHEKDFETDRKVIVRGLKDIFYIKNKNEKEKTKLPVCSGCKRNEDCPGIWKGYTLLYENMGIGQISNSKLELWGLDEVLMQAVLEGIKPCARLEMVRAMDVPKRIGAIKKIGLKFYIPGRQFSLDRATMKFSLSKECSENNYVSIFVSKKKEILNEIIKKTNEEVSPKDEQQRVAATQAIGRLLGYPKCCARSFSKLGAYTDDKATNIMAEERTSGKFNWLLNNLISPYTLIDFYPCSYNCKNAADYAQGMLGLISKSGQGKKNMIKHYLRSVVLYFNFSNYIAFDGSLEGSTISYSSFKSSVDFSKWFMQVKDPYLQLVELLKGGNKISFGSVGLITSIKVFKDSSLVGEIKDLDKNELLKDGHVFNFKPEIRPVKINP